MFIIVMVNFSYFFPILFIAATSSEVISSHIPPNSLAAAISLAVVEIEKLVGLDALAPRALAATLADSNSIMYLMAKFSLANTLVSFLRLLVSSTTEVVTTPSRFLRVIVLGTIA